MQSTLTSIMLRPDPTSRSYSARPPIQPHPPYYDIQAVVLNPTFIALHTDTNFSSDSLRRTENLIERAVELMLHNPLLYTNDTPFDRAIQPTLQPKPHQDTQPTERKPYPMGEFLRCDHCNTETPANTPAASWQQLQSLYRVPQHSAPPNRPVFCSQQCVVNHILQTTDQPLVLTPRKR